MTSCPYCDFEARNAWEEIAHMLGNHRDVIAGRLRLAGVHPQERTFTCPECGAVSRHSQDIEHGYCGRCHAFTDELYSWLRAVAVEHDHGDLSDEEYVAEVAFYRETYLGRRPTT